MGAMLKIDEKKTTEYLARQAFKMYYLNGYGTWYS